MEIVFDANELAQMTTDDLLIQIALRLDRHFPDYEADQLRAAADQQAREIISQYVTDLTALGLIEIAAAVGRVIE